MHLEQQRELHENRLAPWMIQLCRERFSGRLRSGTHTLGFAEGALKSVDGAAPTPKRLASIFAEPGVIESAVITRERTSTSGQATIPLVLEAVRARRAPDGLSAELKLTGVVIGVEPGSFGDEVCDWLRVRRGTFIPAAAASADRVVAAVRAGAAYFVADGTQDAPYRASSALDERGVAALVGRLEHEMYAPSSAAAVLRHTLLELEEPASYWCLEAAELTLRLGRVTESLEWFRQCDDPSSSVVVAWARAVLASEDTGALKEWFERAQEAWPKVPSLRALGFWLARWLGSPELARRALVNDSEEAGSSIDIWAEASQTWPDDPDVVEGYAEALREAGRPGEAAAVLTEATVRLQDPADRARVALLAAEHAAAADWSDWEVAMLIYARRQLPEFELGEGRWQRLLAAVMEAPSGAALAVLKELSPGSRPGGVLRESPVGGPRRLAAESIELHTALLSLDPTDEVARRSLIACASENAADAESVADALERLGRRFLTSEPATAEPFLHALLELCGSTLQQPQRALWAAEEIDHPDVEPLRGRMRVRERVLTVMARDESKRRQVAALWRRCPQHYDEAIEYYQSVVRRDSGDLNALRSIERLKWIVGDLAGAEDALRRQIEATTSDTERRALRRRLGFRASLEVGDGGPDGGGMASRPEAEVWERVTAVPHDAVDALDLVRAMSIGAAWPREAGVVLRLLDVIQGSPTIDDLRRWKHSFGAAAVYYRRALEICAREGDGSALEELSREWVDVHPWDAGAWRQRLLFVTERGDDEGLVRCLSRIYECPMFSELPAEAGAALQGVGAADPTVLGALEAFGAGTFSAVDTPWSEGDRPAEEVEWQLDAQAHDKRPHDFISLAREYRTKEQSTREAWALQRLTIWPSRLDPSWIATSATRP